jgi:hypothetical protein
MRIVKKTLLICLLFLPYFLYGQEGEVRATRPLTKWEKMFPEVRYGENIYKTGSNWLTIGYGRGLHTNKDVINQNFALTYHHRYKAMYFNAGWHYSSREFFLKRPMEQLNDIHLGAGLRFEDRWFNFGFFIGPSYAITWIPVNQNLSKIYGQLGAVVQIETTFKYFYDLGIGTTFYGSFNKRYQVVGIQIHHYFSNAFVTKY